ncbi:methyltransferase domain-containing protein [Ahrensia kielensis]|uniref:methyltransferase domain-containing protein n=1 Tax=Ahrensia kielensis TaxID=76980 RepID=UPI00035FCF3A|nr:methyltransferase domain-containing protein [Ahrensia kielensis]
MSDNEQELADTYNQALAFEKEGQPEKAADLYAKCLSMDPSDMCGASVRLASLGLGEAPLKAPDAYVATLFDQHADDFDDILTGQLQYAVPMQVAEYLAANAPGPYQRMLDLGCGTGLSGMMLLDMCVHATGVDLSENMIDKADERACYDELFVNEAVHYLQEWSKSEAPEHQPFDLLVATDVLPYIGALEDLFDGLKSNAAPNAKLVFSAETLPYDMMEGKDWHITPNQRFAHSKTYLQAMCERAGFSEVELFQDITVRLEQGAPIPGYLVIAQKI